MGMSREVGSFRQSTGISWAKRVDHVALKKANLVVSFSFVLFSEAHFFQRRLTGVP
jgi:hypothetical protein